MAKYIELESALQSVCKGCKIKFDDQPCEPFDCYIRNKLLAVPTIDDVPVVRCRECKYSSYDAILENRWCNSYSGCRKVKDDGFCYLGKRKEGAGNG